MSKARLLVIDIETVRTRNPRIIERIAQEAMDKRPASNTKKELKIAWDTEAAREARAAEALAKTAVDPLLAEPVIVSCMTETDETPQSRSLAPGDRAGLCMVSLWLNDLAGPETVWIGHNLCHFDLAVLLNAWRRARVTPPEEFPVYTNGRWRGRVFDTMLRCPSNTPFVSLAAACEAYGIEDAKTIMWQGEPMNGSRVGDAYDAGEEQMLLEYCEADVRATHELYMAMTDDDRWGTFDRHSEVVDLLAALDESELTEGARAMAKLRVLENAGLVPRAA